MPHSSGGGSHGGGHHSGSHHHSSSSHRSSSSGGSYTYSAPRRARSAPFEGSTTYVYYRKKKPVYVYADYNIAGNGKSALGGKIATVVFFAVVCLLFAILLGVSLGHFPNKLRTDYNTAIVIEDNLGVIDNEDELRVSLEKFYDETGITPAVLTNTNEAWQEYYKNLENYAYDEYVNRFKDERHWLIVYTSSTKEDGFEDWYWEGMQGDDTDFILDSKETDLFTEHFHKYLLQNQCGVGESMAKAFDDLTPVAMKKYLNPGIKYLLIFEVFFMGLIVFMVGFNPKKDIYYPKAQPVNVKQEVIREEACEYCGGVYVIGMHTKCPYCSAPVKPHDFVKDENGKIINIIN